MAIIFDQTYKTLHGIAPYVPPVGISPPYHEIIFPALFDEAYFRFSQPILIEDVICVFTTATYADVIQIDVLHKLDINDPDQSIGKFTIQPIRQYSDIFIRKTLARDMFSARTDSDAGVTWPLKLSPDSAIRFSWTSGPGALPANDVRIKPLIIGSYITDTPG